MGWRRNVLLDQEGFICLADMGFAKKACPLPPPLKSASRRCPPHPLPDLMPAPCPRPCLYPQLCAYPPHYVLPL